MPTKAKTAQAQAQEHTIPGLTYDTDIKGLFKPLQVDTILGLKLRSYKPSVQQYALIVEFLVSSLGDLVSTQAERDSMTRDELFVKCVTKIVEVEKNQQTSEMESIMGYLFSNPKALDYLYEAIKQCYPDIDQPQLLTNEALLEIMNSLLDDVLNN